jgi:hypothetical protein
LGVTADLDERDLGEPGLRVWPYSLDEVLDAVAARNALGDIIRPDVGGRALEVRWSGQLRVDLSYGDCWGGAGVGAGAER